MPVTADGIDEKCEICKYESQGEYLCGTDSVDQQQLGEHERGAPYKHNAQCHYMSQYVASFTDIVSSHDFSENLSIFLRKIKKKHLNTKF
jgi:hypothetical protein